MSARHGRLLVGILVLAPCLAGCPKTPYDVAVDAAKEAGKRGDIAQAALQWNKACDLQPKEKETCALAAQSFLDLKARRMPAAAHACEAADIDACVGSLRDVVAVKPQDPDAERVGLRGFGLWIEWCRAGDTGSLDAGLGAVICMYHGIAVSRRTTDLYPQARVAVAKRFEAASAQKSPGATYGLMKTSACLARAGRESYDKIAEDQLIAAASILILVNVKSTGPVPLEKETLNLCPAVAESLGARAQCGSPEANPVTYDVRVSLGSTRHTVAEEMQVAHYKAGVDRRPNPDRGVAEREVLRASQSFDTVERDKNEKEARCNSYRAKDPHACDPYNAVVDTYNRKADELATAKRKLDATPAYLEFDIIKDVPYTIRHHTWTTPWSFDADGQPGASGTFEYTDSEHPGVTPANVLPDPLVPPTKETFEGDLRRRVVAAAKARFLPEFEARGAACASRPWSFDAPDLECKVISEFLKAGAPPDPRLWMKGVPCDR